VPGGILSAQATLSADPGALASQSLLSPEVDRAKQHRANVSALLDQMTQGASGAAQKAAGFDLKAVAAASLAESKGLHEASLTDAMAREPVLSTALMASGLGEGLMRASDRPGSKSSSQINGLGLEGSWGQSSFQAGNKVDVPSAVIDPSATSFDSALADTMSYWVSQGVQNAELKIEGLDGESIAVSISLNGDEAHIGFRTDKPETRQMLEGAVAHLKELLTSEGLVLSGVSVGASGQEGAPGQEQKNPAGVRQTTLISTENIPAENLRPVVKAVGRALDLYV
jgi:flagellar hook-length control protein FliK